MKWQMLIALSFLVIGALAPWDPVVTTAMENEEPEPEYILAALVVTMLAFVIGFVARQACKRVVLDAKVRRARETGLPAAHMSLALATYSALDQGREAAERLREALGSVAAGRRSLESKDRLLAVAAMVTKDLAGARRELDDVSRERSSRWTWW